MSVRSDELKVIVNDAWAATEALAECEPPNVRQAAFERLLTHLLSEDRSSAAGEAPSISGVSVSNGAAPGVGESLDGSYATEEQRAWAVAQSLQIGIDEVRDLFDLSGEEPTLQMANRKLDAKKSSATRDIALLVCAGRTALGLDTGTQHIREAVDQHARLDPPNFMKTLGAMDQIAVRGSPKSRNRLVRLKVIGIEEARELASKLTG